MCTFTEGLVAVVILTLLGLNMIWYFTKAVYWLHGWPL